MTLLGHSRASTSPEAWFRDLFASHYPDIYGYAARRVGPDDAADVAAEVFTVAWKSSRRVPDGPGARPWLFGVARKMVANHQRARRRRERLAVRATAAEPSPIDTGGFERHDDVTSAMRALSDDDQEILRLAAWEGLEPREIAVVLGCSSNAAAVRLHRARTRLADAYHSRGGRP